MEYERVNIIKKEWEHLKRQAICLEINNVAKVKNAVTILKI